MSILLLVQPREPEKSRGGNFPSPTVSSRGEDKPEWCNQTSGHGASTGPSSAHLKACPQPLLSPCRSLTGERGQRVKGGHCPPPSSARGLEKRPGSISRGVRGPRASRVTLRDSGMVPNLSGLSWHFSGETPASHSGRKGPRDPGVWTYSSKVELGEFQGRWGS